MNVRILSRSRVIVVVVLIITFPCLVTWDSTLKANRFVVIITWTGLKLLSGGTIYSVMIIRLLLFMLRSGEISLPGTMIFI